MVAATREATMRAVALEAAGTARAVRVRVPEPAAGEVLVRVEGCGICGSNLPLWEGRPWFEYPLPPGAPGHEGWGVVEQLGEGVEQPEPGTRVAFLSDRAFADYDVARADELVPLPPELSSVAFPAEPVGCAFNVLRRSGVASHEQVAVVGVGFLGALVVALAAGKGAQVTAVARKPFARELARLLGAAEALAPGEVREEAFDCVFETGGVQDTLDLATRLVAVRGRLVVAGYHQEPRSVDMRLWNWRGIDVVNAHERDPRVYVDGMRAAVEAVARGSLDVRPLITHAFPLERAADGFEAARVRPDGFLKAVVLT